MSIPQIGPSARDVIKLRQGLQRRLTAQPLDLILRGRSIDFLRLRVGVGRPGRGDPRKPADFVLSNFTPEDDPDLLVARAADAVETLDAEGLEHAQARFN